MLARLADELELAQLPDDIVWEVARARKSAVRARRESPLHVSSDRRARRRRADRAGPRGAGQRRTQAARRRTPATRQYYALHATLDIKHSEAWNREVLKPLVDGESRARAADRRGRAAPARSRRPLLRALPRRAQPRRRVRGVNAHARRRIAPITTKHSTSAPAIANEASRAVVNSSPRSRGTDAWRVA